MTRQFFIGFVFIILMASLCSCESRSGVTAETECFKADSVYYAKGFEISRFDDWIIVNVRNPWDTLKTLKRYILVERDKPLPDSLPEGEIIRTPVDRAVFYTTVHSSMVAQMGRIDAIKGICEVQYVTDSLILERIADGRIADIGLATAPNTEKIIDLNTELIIASPFENSGYGAAEKIGIPIVEAADYMESHPLGRTEWGRFYGLLFGEGEKADSIFFATSKRYNHLKELAAKSTCRPRVLLERKYGASWIIPAGDSYIGTIHADAGADYIFSNIKGNKNVYLTFESVFDKAHDADIWLFKYFTNNEFTYEVLKDEYLPYSNFKPFKEKNIYICHTTRTGYYDDITLHPDRLLEDLIFIYHPELLPEYTPRFYFPMK